MDRIAGVYQIKNMVNGKIYIGSSVNLKNRWYSHKSRLRRNVHKNPHLQAAWNKYGEGNFKFSVLEACDRGTVLELEQVYLDRLSPDYNVFKYSEYTRRDNHLSDEHKTKISRSKKGTNTGKNNHFYGRRHTKETKRKISEYRSGRSLSDEHKKHIGDAQIGEKSHYAKLTWNKVREIRNLFASGKYTEAELVRMYNMSQSAINKLLNYKTWR